MLSGAFQVAAGGAGLSSLIAQNGLTFDGTDTIEWGGTLLHDTVIVNDGFDVRFDMTNDGNIFFTSQSFLLNTFTDCKGNRFGDVLQSNLENLAQSLFGGQIAVTDITDSENIFSGSTISGSDIIRCDDLYLLGETLGLTINDCTSTILKGNTNATLSFVEDSIFGKISPNATFTNCANLAMLGECGQMAMDSSENIFSASLYAFANLNNSNDIYLLGSNQSFLIFDSENIITSSCDNSSLNFAFNSVMLNSTFASMVSVNDSYMLNCQNVSLANSDRVFFHNVGFSDSDNVTDCFVVGTGSNTNIELDTVDSFFYLGNTIASNRIIQNIDDSFFLGNVNFPAGSNFSVLSQGLYAFGNVDIGNNDLLSDQMFLGARRLLTPTMTGVANGNMFLNVGDVSGYSLSGSNKTFLTDYTILNNNFELDIVTQPLTSNATHTKQSGSGTYAFLSDIPSVSGDQVIVDAYPLQNCNVSVTINNNTCFMTQKGVQVGSYIGMVVFIGQNALVGAEAIPIEACLYNASTGFKVTGTQATSTVTGFDGIAHKAILFDGGAVNLSAALYQFSFWKGQPPGGNNIQIQGRNDAYTNAAVNGVFSNAGGLPVDLATVAVGSRNTVFYVALF